MIQTIILCPEDEKSMQTFNQLKDAGKIPEGAIIVTSMKEVKSAIIASTLGDKQLSIIESLDDLMQQKEKDPMELIENIKRDAAKMSNLVQPTYFDDFTRHNHERPKYFTKKSKFNKRKR